MKLFGCALDDALDDQGAGSPKELREATFVASPRELRDLAAFFGRAAALMEANPESFGHEHFSMRGLPQIIVSS